MLPAFSPDGRTIAFLARAGLNAYGRNVQLFTVPSDGGHATCLSSALDRSCGALHVRPSWSPDGRSLTVAAEDRGDVGLWRLAATGGAAPQRIVAGERVLNGFSASADGRRLAFASSRSVAPAEVFVCGADGDEERRLTELADDTTQPPEVNGAAKIGIVKTRAVLFGDKPPPQREKEKEERA